ncbi:MAG: muconolactone Delta-isomerase family protein [Saprospiraceae bacterium]
MKYFNILRKTITSSPLICLEFMVEFTMPDRLSNEFISGVPRQRKLINRYMKNRKILSYALSIENYKMWAVFQVGSEEELMHLIAELPLSAMMDVQISSLTILNIPKDDLSEICMN